MTPVGPRADSAAGRVPLVDVHAHFVTGDYVASAPAAGHEHPDGMRGWPCWSADEHLRLMDRWGVRRSVLSISSPGTHFGDDAAARTLTRQVNKAGAATALDELGSDGVTIESSAGGVYTPATPGSSGCTPNSTGVTQWYSSSCAAGWRELTTRNAARLFDRTR